MRRQTLIALGVAIILGLIAVFLANTYLSSREKQLASSPEGMVRVAVAALPLSFGADVTPDKVKFVNYPADSLPPGTYQSMALLLPEGKPRVALRPILINQPLLAGDLSGEGQNASIAALLPDGMRAATVSINDVSGVAGFVKPNDTVDVLITRQPIGGDGSGNGRQVTDVLLQNIRVIAMDQRANNANGQAIVSRTATLELTPVDAQKVALGQQLGQLSLVLRKPGEEQNIPSVETVSLDDLRYSYYGSKAPSVGEGASTGATRAAATPPAVRQARIARITQRRPAPVRVVAPPPPSTSTVAVTRGLKPVHMRWGVMIARITGAALGAAIAVTAAIALPSPAAAQISVSEGNEVRAGELAVPLNKSQVLRSDRPFAKALIGNPEIADILPLTDQSLYVLGKKMGTTSLTLYDSRNLLIAVIDIAVGPDVTSLKRQLSELMPNDQVGARIANDSVILEGTVSSGPAADRAVQVAETYAPGKVVNLLSIGSAQQVMLEVRFSEIKRGALKDLGLSGFVSGSGDHGFQSAFGSGANFTSSTGTTTTTVTDPVTGAVTTTNTPNPPQLALGAIVDSFGILSRMFRIGGLNIDATLNALERKGVVTTLAEPTLVALSGETASFLAGGEFPIPVAQGSGGGDNGIAISVQFKPFGVSLAFTPTVLADGVINMEVAPEVSSIDPSASIVINNLRVPGLQTRRAKTTVELRDGESFAMAGLLRRDFQDTVRQFPILGSIPIIGALFRSTNFQKEETELVIIVTPRLVRPVRAGSMRLPTDRATPPNEADLFLLGRTDGAVGVNPLAPTQPSPVGRPVGQMPQPQVVVPSAGGGMAALDPSKLEKDYGHAL